jgi:NAD(P)-dependent dehydrogenase (short-subunit alcohol dehydrogenase family)
VVIVPCGGAPGDLAEAARETTQGVLDLLTRWLADERFTDARLVLVTTGAVPMPGETPNLRTAPLVGLVRTAQTEHPGRITLIDTDPASRPILPAAIGTAEPQLVLRGGVVHVPRLAQVKATHAAPQLDPDGTVLITGGTGGLGAVVARHLVAEHGVRHLLLLSRRGRDADGVAELERELDATVTVAACDVTDRDALAAVIAAIPGEHPLTAVVHSAGVLDDGVIEAITPERLDRVLRPKVDAATHLHELTAGYNLAAFVLFSSIAGIIGGAGQGNYAAGNAFLDALAQLRRAEGLAASSIAWGLWADASDLTRHLSDADLARLSGSGLAPLSTEDGLRLFDLAWSGNDPLTVAARLNTAGLRAQARSGTLPAVLRGLVHVPARARATSSLADRLAGVAEQERDAVVLDVVLTEVAAVLGYATTGAIEPGVAFKDLGFDSLGAVQLRNRLATATGLKLPSVLVFDHPTPASVANHVRSRLSTKPGRAQVDEHLDRLAALLSTADETERERIGARLRPLLAAVDSAGTDGAGERIRTASAEELFDLIDRDLGR